MRKITFMLVLIGACLLAVAVGLRLRLGSLPIRTETHTPSIADNRSPLVLPESSPAAISQKEVTTDESAETLAPPVPSVSHQVSPIFTAPTRPLVPPQAARIGQILPGALAEAIAVAHHTPVSIPLALFQPTADLNLTEAQKTSMNDLAQQFYEESGATEAGVNPSDPKLLQRWQAAQIKVDEQLRVMMGYEAYNQLYDQLYESALTEK